MDPPNANKGLFQRLSRKKALFQLFDFQLIKARVNAGELLVFGYKLSQS